MMRLFLLLFLFLLPGCDSKGPLTHFTGLAMTVPYRVTIGEPLSFQKKKQVEAKIQAVFEKTHQIYNNWNPHSEVSKLATLAAGEKISLSPELKDLLLLAKKIHLSSAGRFDPTVGLVAQIWKKALCEGKIPQNVDNESVGFNLIHMEQDLFWKDHSQTSLDLGGIAKGAAVDLLTEELKKAGFDSLYVEWGGEIRTCGVHPEGRKWVVGIKGVATVELSNCALATSGNYEQFWHVEEKCFTHILDPRTKMPLLVLPHRIASATVMAKTCAEADAIATALMLFETPQEALAWAETLPDVQCWLATQQ